jgi:sulfatase modifying factor 1
MRILAISVVLVSMLACNANKKADDKAESSISESEINSTPQTEMVTIKGGTFNMGSNSGLPNEMPAHEVKVADFRLDKYPVTVAEFARFVKATSYLTDAERFGDAGVYNFQTQNWELKRGANWRKPFGPDGEAAQDDYPVTQVSWNDAQAYCKWAKKRLPTEAEWEYAARNAGKTNTLYSWGNELIVDGKFKANVWQGVDINEIQGEDGFKFTSPVGYFGVNQLGIADMGGNVWNWCEDTFAMYPGNNEHYTVDPNSKVMRGGSFFFDPALGKSFTVTFRAPNTAETSLFNIGFRCAGNGE